MSTTAIFLWQGFMDQVQARDRLNPEADPEETAYGDFFGDVGQTRVAETIAKYAEAIDREYLDAGWEGFRSFPGVFEYDVIEFGVGRWLAMLPDCTLPSCEVVVNETRRQFLAWVLKGTK